MAAQRAILYKFNSNLSGKTFTVYLYKSSLRINCIQVLQHSSILASQSFEGASPPVPSKVVQL